jgi:hypothetical protein
MRATDILALQRQAFVAAGPPVADVRQNQYHRVASPPFRAPMKSYADATLRMARRRTLRRLKGKGR